MAKRAFKKNVKKYAALFTLATIFLGTSISYAPVKEATALETEVKSTAVKRNVMYYGDWSIWGGQGNFYPYSC